VSDTGPRPAWAIAARAIPADWREAVAVLRALDVVRRGDMARIGALSVLVVLTEAFGLFMVLPVLQFIEGARDVAHLAATSRLWSVLVEVFGAVHLPISLATLSLVVLALITLRQVVAYVHTMTLVRIKERIGRELRDRAFRQVMASKGAHIQSLGSGAFLNLTRTLCPAAAAVLEGCARLGAVMLSFVVYGIGLMLIAPVATVASLVLALFLARIVRRFRLAARALSEQLVRNYEGFIQFMSERYQSWRLVKLSDSLDYESELIGARTQRIAALNIDIVRAGSMMHLYIIPVAALFALSGLYISVEHLALTMADMTMFLVVMLRVVPLINSILGSRQRLATTAANMARAHEHLARAEAAIEADNGTRPFDALEKGIGFQNVSFAYGGPEVPALEGVTVTIPAGKITAITGPSGAGKSTLVDMLPRLIAPTGGQIVIDGVPLQDFELASLRQNISFVSQSPLLFGGTVAENVRYARPDAPMAEVVAACRKAYAEEFISELPDGFDTVIGEGGATLSGGQRQRLVLARAFLSDADLLILDEPTSSLDYKSEHYIQKAVEETQAATGMTVIVIAHRLSTIRNADQVIVLDRGRVIEQGAPDALGHEDSWYADMLSLDMAGRRRAETLDEAGAG